MSRRLWINLAAFSLLFVILAGWAVRNVVQLDALERPYRVTAQFGTSPGLRSGFEVAYLGVRVGRLGSVKLHQGQVDAVLKIERSVKLPAVLNAAVRRMSAVGEPYVDLSPTGGVDPGGPRLRAGTVIPRARTTTPLQYSELFNAVDNLLKAVPANDLGRLLDSLAAGFQGRSEDIRTTFTSIDDIAATLAAHAPLLDQLANDLTRLTHTVTEHRDAIGQSWDNLAGLSQTLAANKDNLAGLIDKTPTFASDVQKLLKTTGPDIGCIFDSSGALWSALNKPDLITAFGQLVSLSGPVADIVKQAAYSGPDGPYLNGSFLFNAGLYPVKTYNPPLQLAAPKPVPACQAASLAGSAGSMAPTAANGAGAGGGGPRGAPTALGRPGGSGGLAQSSTNQPKGGTDWWRRGRQAAAVLALVAVLLLILAVRPWRLVQVWVGRGIFDKTRRSRRGP
jgi:phospholipid/cholesterol/gamma-HCH transport system substrate-binding protein